MKFCAYMGLLAVTAIATLSSSAQPAAPGDYNADPGAVTAQGDITPPAEISPGAAEIIRMASSGVSEDVLLAYVNNAQTRFELSADQVVYLKDLGVSPNVVTAMINRDSSLQGSAPVVDSNPQSATPPPPSEPPVVEGPMTAGASAIVETAPPEDVSYFYNDLAPYGTWVTLEGVGWCWQPRTVVIAHGWRPYCDGGRWVYSDCGWYWASDYSWGWAPFHYGRWYMHPRCGWVWTPDRTWGPAWVTWRVGGDNCGWAPLPPHALFVGGSWRFNGVHVGVNFDFGLRPDHFTFVGVHDFIGRDLRHHSLPVHEVRNVYRQTTIVNNTTIVHNNVIVNRGIPVDRVSAVTHTSIKPAVLREGPAGPGRVEHRVGRGSEPVVYRHELPSHPKPVKVTAERVDASHPIVHHNELPPVRTERSLGSSTSARTRYENRPSTVDRTPASHGQPQRSTPAAPTSRDTRENGSRYNPLTKPAYTPNPHGATPAQPKSSPPVVEGPRTSGERFNYGRYGDTPRNNSGVQSPKQTTVEPSHQWTSKPSGGSSYQAPSHEYVPKSYQQHHETYTPPPSRVERAPAYTPPSHSERSYSAPSHSERSYSAPAHSERSSGGNSSARDNSRDESGSAKRH